MEILSCFKLVNVMAVANRFVRMASWSGGLYPRCSWHHPCGRHTGGLFSCVKMYAPKMKHRDDPRPQCVIGAGKSGRFNIKRR